MSVVETALEIPQNVSTSEMLTDYAMVFLSRHKEVVMISYCCEIITNILQAISLCDVIKAICGYVMTKENV